MFSLRLQWKRSIVRLATIALSTLAISAAFTPADAGKRNQRPIEETARETLSGPPVIAIVSIKDQRVTVYDANGGSMSGRVSSGRDGYETPVGVYSVLQKEEEHYSNLYDDASMPFMQRITWSGIALHAGQLPGYPASHGCVRMPDSFAQRLFPLTKLGMRVVVAYDDVAPVEISHPLLMKPTPLQSVQTATAIPMSYQDPIVNDPDSSPTFSPDLRAWPERQVELNALKSIADGKQILADAALDQAKEMEQIIADKKAPRDRAAKALRKAEAAKKSADSSLAAIDKRLSNAKSDKLKKKWTTEKERAAKKSDEAAAKVATATEALQAAEAELQKATDQAAPALAARDQAVAVLNEAKRKALPISVFISLKTQRLYVRQGNEPVFDAPVTIADPQQPIGTHVFTAVGYKNGGKDVSWTAVSLEHNDNADYAFNEDRRYRLNDAGTPPPTNVAEASAALDRITISPDVSARLSSAVWPGSSLIVSDEPMSKETGKATDFIVLISTEPQGGIKKRPKQFFRNDNFMSDSADYYYYGYDRYGRRAYPRQRSMFGWW
ncbi:MULTISPECIES: L,D-transpeptidase family protein [unclassified Hyphomicrobium]|uniref:L,D-transpeptidase family protein n=1 Tax=unclassified Hyphomicrobium TaxID=2619925 RepID=UPI000213DACC|nr:MULTISPECIES: L,D-transpeptidase family protein [unclassified Hyphomicrobium]CCB65103.1 ErfK/YbiS/YcfS/YnhG family protein [Hyphomicrobium sp. MC1]